MPFRLALVGLLALAGIACTEACTIYSLPGTRMSATGPATLIAASDANAAAYCQARGGGAGASRTATLGELGAAAAWDLASGAQQTAPDTQVFTGLECVFADAPPCATDSRGNFGLVGSNGGSHNFGSFNGGAHNVGNGNGGSYNKGDQNAGDGTVGNSHPTSGARSDLSAFLDSSPNTITADGAAAPTPAPAPAPEAAPAGRRLLSSDP